MPSAGLCLEVQLFRTLDAECRSVSGSTTV